MSGAKFDPAALRAARPRVLMVLHAGDGGVERHVRELSRLLAGTAEVLWLRPRAHVPALPRGEAARLDRHHRPLARHLLGLPRTRRARDRAAEPAVTLPPATLAWLYEDGVLCGWTRSRERLRRQAAEADSALVQLREALEETGRDRDRTRAELARIHRSRSWKLTAPIRALARRLRGS